MTANNEIIYRRSTDGGVSFGAPLGINLSNNPGDSGSPVVAVSGNNVYVVWFDGTPWNNEIFYRRSTDDGMNFESNINLSNKPQFHSVNPEIAASGSIVHVVWDENFPGTINYAVSLDGGATFDPTLSSLNINPIGPPADTPSIAAS